MRRRNPVWWPLTVSVPSLGRRKDRLGLRLWGGQGRVRPGPGLGTEKLSLTAPQYYEWTAGRQAGLHYLSLLCCQVQLGGPAWSWSWSWSWRYSDSHSQIWDTQSEEIRQSSLAADRTLKTLWLNIFFLEQLK